MARLPQLLSSLGLVALLLVLVPGQFQAEATAVRMVQFGSLRIPVKDGAGRDSQKKTQEEARAAKSLLKTFPFSEGAHHHDHHDHDHHDDHHHDHNHVSAHQDVDSGRAFRQGAAEPPTLDIGSIAAAGERCVDKVVMTEETEYDDVIECRHSYTERCFDTYKTDYSPQQEEECDENYKKSCFIEYKTVAQVEKVKFCFQPLVKNCDTPGPEECTTEYQSVCTTRYHEHDVEEDEPECVDEEEVKCEQVTQGYTTEEKCSRWPVKKCQLQKKQVKKYTPETECEKVPFELCGPSSCPVEPGPEQCQDKDETVVQEVPEEVCHLEPQRECSFVTKLVPLLKAVQECVDIPKEVCVRSRRNPRRVQKPIVKKWCYTPTEESGLGFGQQLSNGNNNQHRPDRPINHQEQEGCLRGRPVNYCPSRAENGRCDPECNTPDCGYDAGECRPTPTTTTTTTRRPTTRRPTTTTARPGCLAGRPFDYCPRRANDGRCDPECNTAACLYDGGDCRVEEPQLGYLPPPPSNSNRRRNQGYSG